MDDQEAFEGDDFTFQVDCDGSPKPVAKWTKEGKGIDTKDGHFTIVQADPNAYRLIIKGKYKNQTSMVFHSIIVYSVNTVINVYPFSSIGVKEEDAGEYQIELTNRAGDKKCAAALTVHCKFNILVPKRVHEDQTNN